MTASNQLTYTFQLGNGVSVALSAQDQSNYTQGQLWNLSAATATGVASGNWGTNDFAGNRAPDLIAMVRLDQAWGQFQASFAAHQNTAGFYSNVPGPFAGQGLPFAISAGVEPGGHPSDNIAVALAFGEWKGASGHDVLASIILGYEVYSRALLPYLSRHLPGHPQFVMQEMPGAGGPERDRVHRPTELPTRRCVCT